MYLLPTRIIQWLPRALWLVLIATVALVIYAGAVKAAVVGWERPDGSIDQVTCQYGGQDCRRALESAIETGPITRDFWILAQTDVTVHERPKTITTTREVTEGCAEWVFTVEGQPESMEAKQLYDDVGNMTRTMGTVVAPEVPCSDFKAQ